MTTSNSTNSKTTKKDVKIRLDAHFIDELDAMASRAGQTRNAIIGLLLREGIKHSTFAFTDNPSKLPEQ